MRTLILILALLPFAATAQLVVRDGKATTELTESAATPATDDGTGPVEAVIMGTNIPATAITAIGTDGQVRDGTSLPVTPPVKKITPVDSKLWPSDTVEIFVPQCAKMHRELDAMCACTIHKVMATIPHDEFIVLSNNGKIEGDTRYQQARRDCIGTQPQAPAQ